MEKRTKKRVDDYDYTSIIIERGGGGIRKDKLDPGSSLESKIS